MAQKFFPRHLRRQVRSGKKLVSRGVKGAAKKNNTPNSLNNLILRRTSVATASTAIMNM